MSTLEEEYELKLAELKKSLEELKKGDIIPFKPKQKAPRIQDAEDWNTLSPGQKADRAVAAQPNNPYKEAAPSKGFQPATGLHVDPKYVKAKENKKYNVKQGTPEEIAAMNAQGVQPPTNKPSSQPIKYPGLDMQHDPKTNQTHIAMMDGKEQHIFTVDHAKKTIMPWISDAERGSELNEKFKNNPHLQKLFPDHTFQSTFSDDDRR